MKLPVKVVIFNNGVLGFVAMEMKASGFVESGVQLQNPDFAAMARAMGIYAVRAEDPGELPEAIREVLAYDGPAVLDAITATQELSMPPTIGREQIRGFSLWVLRAVMSGRGDEVLDLARTNLLPR
jgi:pyruvate dehydrogenase (quinone)